ncbi:phospholipase, partial [filamentous cyanobacterium CCT1]
MAGVAQRVLQILGLGATAYLALCALLWVYQRRLIFFPQAELTLTPADLGLAYEDVWIPVGEGRIHGWWLPSGQPQGLTLLYLHGNGGNVSTNLPKAAT